jgi:hypothetical protein
MRDNVLIAVLVIFSFFLALLIFYVGLMQVTKWVKTLLCAYRASANFRVTGLQFV